MFRRGLRGSSGTTISQLICRHVSRINKVDQGGKMNVGNKELAQESIQVGQIRIRYLIDGSVAGGMGVFELSVPPKSIVPPPHSHTLNEECVYYIYWRGRFGTQLMILNAIYAQVSGCSPLVVRFMPLAIHTVKSLERSSF